MYMLQPVGIESVEDIGGKLYLYCIFFLRNFSFFPYKIYDIKLRMEKEKKAVQIVQ